MIKKKIGIIDAIGAEIIILVLFDSIRKDSKTKVTENTVIEIKNETYNIEYDVGSKITAGKIAAIPHINKFRLDIIILYHNLSNFIFR